MENSSAFPLEIYFEIIDSIASDKTQWDASITIPATLRACALTCSAWLERARHRLYEDVEISERTHPDQIWSFAQTLIDFPASAALVKRLCIHLGEVGAEHWKNEENALAEFPPEAIRQLTGLETLDFECLDWVGPGCEPSLLSAVFAFSIATSARTLLLAGFTFESLAVVVSHLKNFGHIQSLHFITTSWIDHEVPASEIGPDFLPNLTYLELSGNVLEDNLLQIMPPTIRTLKLGPPTDYHEDTDPDESYAALSRYTQLESLILNTEMLGENHADWFSEALSFVRSPGLHTITFIYGHVDSVEEVAKYSQLLALDAIMSNEPFLHVQRILVEIGVHVEQEEDVATKLQLIERYIRVDALRQCQQRGVQVQVNCQHGPVGLM